MSPLTVQVRAPVVVQVLFPGLLVTVYLVILLPPVVGALQVTTASLFPAEASGGAGVDGLAAFGVTEPDGVDVDDVPITFCALTLNV